MKIKHLYIPSHLLKRVAYDQVGYGTISNLDEILKEKGVEPQSIINITPKGNNLDVFYVSSKDDE